jgi:erythromycin esterase-like protein
VLGHVEEHHIGGSGAVFVLSDVGVDMQDPFPNLFHLDQFARQKADTVLRRQVRELLTYYFALRKANYQAATPTKRRIQRLSDELAHHVHAAAAPTAMQQHAQVLVQRSQLLQQGPLGLVRDQAMATNMAWLRKQELSAKVLVWAHNEHIRRDDFRKRMGYYLTHQFGPAYVAVGLATGQGQTNVFASDGTFYPVPLLSPAPHSFEAWLNQASPPNYLLLLRPVPLSGCYNAGYLAKSVPHN